MEYQENVGMIPAQEQEQEQEKQEFEVSKELLEMQTDEESEHETGAANSSYEEPTKDELKQAQAVAVDIAGFAFGALQAATGNSYGLDEAAAQKWANGVAPCLVKYRLTDTSAIFNKWDAEVKAAIATGAVIFGIMREHKQYQKALENGNKPQ